MRFVRLSDARGCNLPALLHLLLGMRLVATMQTVTNNISRVQHRLSRSNSMEHVSRLSRRIHGWTWQAVCVFYSWPTLRLTDELVVPNWYGYGCRVRHARWFEAASRPCADGGRDHILFPEYDLVPIEYNNAVVAIRM